MIEIKEIIKNNYIIDVWGIGVPNFQFSKEDAERVIKFNSLFLFSDSIEVITVKANSQKLKNQQINSSTLFDNQEFVFFEAKIFLKFEKPPKEKFFDIFTHGVETHFVKFIDTNYET